MLLAALIVGLVKFIKYVRREDVTLKGIIYRIVRFCLFTGLILWPLLCILIVGFGSDSLGSLPDSPAERFYPYLSAAVYFALPLSIVCLIYAKRMAQSDRIGTGTLLMLLPFLHAFIFGALDYYILS